MVGSMSKASICILALLLVLSTVLPVFSQQSDQQAPGGQLDSYLLTVGDILDWPGILAKLTKDGTKTEPSPSRRVWELLPRDVQNTLLNAEQTRILDQAGKLRVVNALNEILKRRDFFKDPAFLYVAAYEAKGRLGNYVNELPDKEIEWLNRRLLEAAFPKGIAKSRMPPGKKTYEEVEEIGNRYRAELAKVLGFVGIGIGVNKDGFVFHVLINSAEAKRLIPQTIEGIPTEVLVGEIKLNDDYCNPPPAACQHRNLFGYPVPMGVSTSTGEACNVGTLGFKACESADSIGYVTAHHVAAVDRNGCPNISASSIEYHRALFETYPVCALERNIGTLRSYVSIVTPPGVNYADAAFVWSNDGTTSRNILDIGVPTTYPRPQTDLRPGETVWKSGRTTGRTWTTVFNNRVDFDGYDFRCIGQTSWRSQILLNPSTPLFGQSGDSGAAVLDGALNIIGLYWADFTTGGVVYPIVSPINEVLNRMLLYLDCTPSGSISASPANVCASTSGVGTTTISWNTNQFARNNVAVRVSQNGGAESVFASGRSGPQDAAWIASGSTYSFRLYENTGLSLLGGNLLNQTTVLGVSCGSISADPQNVLLCPGEVGTSYLTWSTTIDARPFVAVRVSQNGAPEVVFSGNPSGIREPATWIAFGSTYVFTLYENSGSNLMTGGNPIASVTVQGVRDPKRCP